MIHHNWNSSMKTFFSMQKKLFVLRSDLIDAHTKFSEILSGNKMIDIESEVIIPLENVTFTRYSNLLKEKESENKESILKPLIQINEHLNILSSLAKKNLNNGVIQNLKEKEFDKHFELTLSNIDSTIAHISEKFESKIVDKNRLFTYVFVISICIYITIFILILMTRRKNLKQAKIFSEQLKMVSMGELIGNIAHQWRQPLSAISTGVTGMALKKDYNMLNDKDFYETCEKINKNAQYLSKTIDYFSKYIKCDAQKIEFNVLDEINIFLDTVNKEINGSEVELIVNIDSSLIITGYRNEFIQSILNLFDNTKEAFVHKKIIEKKYIFITASIKKNTLEFKMKDNAGGIPENVLKRMYEPYFTTKHKSQGTGLGLHMTYNLITNGMNGTIKAETVEYLYNKKKYKGAEFIIRIPI